MEFVFLPKFPNCVQKGNVGLKGTEDNQIIFLPNILCHVLGIIFTYLMKNEEGSCTFIPEVTVVTTISDGLKPGPCNTLWMCLQYEVL